MAIKAKKYHYYIKHLLALCLACSLLAGCNTNEALLNQIKSQTPALRTRLDALQTQGIDIAYPLVRLTVLEQFIDFVEEDIAQGEVQRARQQIEEMEQILKDCGEELTSLEAGELNPDVPRYVTSPLQIENGAFKAKVKWHDGSETDDWPVIFTGYGHFETVMRDVELLQDYGMNIIIVELGPSWILLSEEEIEMQPIYDFLALLDRAQTANVTVSLLISTHYFPQWAYDKWPEILIGAGEYLPFSVDSEHVRSILDKYLRTLIPEIADHPALHSLCLSNEPSYFNAALDPENRKAYTTWLQKEYSSIGAVSEAHGNTYETFDDVPLYPQGEGDYPDEVTDLRAHYDYYRFNDERFASWHQWMADIIHELAPNIPVHSKFSDYTQYVPFEGVDPESFLSFSQIAGNDAVKYYSESEEDYYANDWMAQNIFYDLLRSISGMPSYNSENHLIRDFENIDVPPAHIRNVIWQASIHGEGASTSWVWERNLIDSEYTGLPITTIMYQPQAVVEHGRTGLDLLRLGKEFNAFQTSQARVALVYSPTSLLYNYFNGNYELLLVVTYEALNFTGEKIDFITESELAQGKGEQYQFIFVTGATHLSQDAYLGLSNYVAAGGHLVLRGEGNLAYDQLNQSITQTISKVTQIPDLYQEDLRDYILLLLDTPPNGRSVKVVEADSGEEAWGVEWRYVEYNGQKLLNLTNYRKDSVRVSLEGFPEKGRIDLITMEEVGETLTIKSLAVHLISAP
jgi:hypothetical protein